MVSQWDSKMKTMRLAELQNIRANVHLHASVQRVIHSAAAYLNDFDVATSIQHLWSRRMSSKTVKLPPKVAMSLNQRAGRVETIFSVICHTVDKAPADVFCWESRYRWHWQSVRLLLWLRVALVPPNTNCHWVSVLKCVPLVSNACII